MNRTIGLIFSKDRAMQLDAALWSLWLHCRDINEMDVKVLYAVSDPIHDKQYRQLAAEHPSVQFIRERRFKEQLEACIAEYSIVLFMVDDCLFVRPFYVKDCRELLDAHDEALGFSLRLGTNTSYCYSMDRYQPFPKALAIEKGCFKWDWTDGEGDFGYPLEVSSSIYRTSDLLPWIIAAPYSNPNTLEANLAGSAGRIAGLKRYVISYETSVAFCNPVNKVQQVYANRSGTNDRYSAEQLKLLYEQGYRIIVETYSGFTPYACHQEVELFFRGGGNG